MRSTAVTRPMLRPAVLLPVLLLGSAFTALAGLVAAGTATGLDAYAVHHWMPGLDPRHATEGASIVGALVPFYGTHSPGALDLGATVVTLPAYVLVATALFGLGCWALARRESLAAATPWAAAFVAGNLVEVVSKHFLLRPALTARTAAGLIHLVSFDASYPSGHALRSCLLVALAVRLWPRVWPAAAGWAAASLVLLVAAGIHALTDVVGGVLLAAFLVAAAHPAARLPRLRATWPADAPGACGRSGAPSASARASGGSRASGR